MAGALAANPFAEIARRNMEMFTSAAQAGKPAAPAGDTRAELDDLKAQLAELQQKLNKLAG